MIRVLARGKKVILVQPFVSVVCEKLNYFIKLLSTMNVSVDGFYGGHSRFRDVNGDEEEQPDLAICTIEKVTLRRSVLTS